MSQNYKPQNRLIKLNTAKKLFDLFHIFISIFIVILDDAVTPEYEMVEHYITFYKE